MIFDKLIISTDLLNSMSKFLFVVCIRNFESQYLTFTCWSWLSQYLNRKSIWQLCVVCLDFHQNNIFSFINIISKLLVNIGSYSPVCDILEFVWAQLETGCNCTVWKHGFKRGVYIFSRVIGKSSSHWE